MALRYQKQVEKTDLFIILQLGHDMLGWNIVDRFRLRGCHYALSFILTLTRRLLRKGPLQAPVSLPIFKQNLLKTKDKRKTPAPLPAGKQPRPKTAFTNNSLPLL